MGLVLQEYRMTVKTVPGYHVAIVSLSSEVLSAEHLVLVHTERALDLVADRLVGGAVDVVVLGAAQLVAEGLGGSLVGV